MTAHTDYLNRLGRTSDSDEVYTPREAVEPLLPFIDKTLIYYEPTSNTSSKLLRALHSCSVNIVESGGKDFFDCGKKDIYDGIITNPPYSIKDKFIKKCYDLGKPFALLLPVSSLQGQTRGKFFIEHGLSALVLNKRVDFTGKGSPNFGNVWIMGNGFDRPDFKPSGHLYFVDN